MLIMATLFAFGQWGAYVLPQSLHLLFNSGLIFGCNNYTTLVLSLYMREQTHRGGTVVRRSNSFWWYVRKAAPIVLALHRKMCAMHYRSTSIPLPPGATEGSCEYSSSSSCASRQVGVCRFHSSAKASLGSPAAWWYGQLTKNLEL